MQFRNLSFSILINKKRSLGHGICKYYHVTIKKDVNIMNNTPIDKTETVLYKQQIEDLQNLLKHKRKDFQQFEYAVSHDLQEPLRMIEGFGSLLYKKFQGRINQEETEYFNFIKDATFRARKMIEGLLQISRISTKTRSFSDINLNDMIVEVSEMLSYQIQETKATLEYKNLPVIKADADDIRQLLFHLIDNAIKFHKPKVPPQVVISGSINEKEIKFEVRDNGIGFDIHFLDKIFVIFQKLHASSKYEGLGIGLAISKKIVEQYDGRIEVASKEGEGTAFLVTVPIKQEIDEKEKTNI